MKLVLSAVGDLGMDRLDLALAALPLRLGEFRLQIAVKPIYAGEASRSCPTEADAR